ncbi:MAG TPA: OmpA family protein, partial [Bacteroidales bacterium]|nr:OmpA family protein [Bacteroidales bacterium]
NVRNELIAVFRSNSATGKFLVSLPAGKNYGIAVAAPNYLFHSENFDLPEGAEYQIVEKEIRLKNACIGCSIVLNNIFFDVGKHTLRPESTAELNRLAQLLKDILKVKPGTRVELSGHTDNTGSETTNQTLSANRAKAVVDFLITQGVPSGMLTFKGYGSSQPVASNADAAGRQKNRRTEFKIIE